MMRYYFGLLTLTLLASCGSSSKVPDVEQLRLINGQGNAISWNTEQKKTTPSAPDPRLATMDQPVSADGKWKSRNLRWQLEVGTVPQGVNLAELEKDIERCFGYWEASGIFRFEKAEPRDPAEIMISFGQPSATRFKQEHDRMAFAFYPTSGRPGRIYLNPDQKWSTSELGVLTDPITEWLPHEIGHVLGLHHSPNPDSIMYGTGPFGKPSKRDLDDLRFLYGVPKS